MLGGERCNSPERRQVTTELDGEVGKSAAPFRTSNVFFSLLLFPPNFYFHFLAVQTESEDSSIADTVTNCTDSGNER